MIYTKEEVKSLLEKGTHVIYNDGSDGVRDLLIELYPEDKYFQKGGSANSDYEYISFKKQWFFEYEAEGRVVIHLRDIKCLELQVWNSILKEWVDYDGLHKFRLKPNRDSELERLAEELGYNLIKK